ncbi:MAG TPA: hypothetical protein PK361_02525 [Chiayiivirga sp.]|nr:hypothetical protein [Chiayiivirga sp.]
MEKSLSTALEVEPDARLEKRTRRRFSGAEKQRLFEFEQLGHGDKGAWLRRQGLYAAQLSQWRRELREHGLEGLQPKMGGRKPATSAERELATLKRENEKLHKRVRIAESLVELQKKLMALVELDAKESTP